MKKILTLTLIAGLPFIIRAQSLSPTVIASTGGFSSNANGSLSYTVGEMTMVQTFSAGGNILTQGFQQPNDLGVGILDLSQDGFGSFMVYPNPAIDDMLFGFQFPEAGKVEISVFDYLGQKMADIYTANYTDGKVVETMNVSSYAAGNYLLTIYFTSANGQKHTLTEKFIVIN